MASGHGVDKPRTENHPGRQVGREHWGNSERDMLTGQLLNPPGAVPTGERDMLTGQPIKDVPRPPVPRK